MSDISRTGQVSAPFLDDRQYRLFVEAVTDYAIYMLNPDGVIESWNSGAERFNGYSSVEIIGCNFAIFYTLEDQASDEPKQALQTASAIGRFETEGWRIRKDGSRFWASVVIDSIRENGKLIGFAKITRDISERKEAEQALTRANSALLQSQKMEAIGQLTGGIAHDFNNPLAAVLGSLELLRKRLPSDPKASLLLENAVQGARRGTALIQRMLAFARRQELAPKPVDLTTMVREMTPLLQTTLGPMVTVETRIPHKLDMVIVDPNQLDMALLNLAVNARDAMPDGGVILIDVREAWLEQGQVQGLAAGSYACLTVKDSGVGMDEVTLSRAIEPFYTTKEAGQGTGLGLSMVHGMALQSKGCLELKSEVGNGTTAELWLPLAPTAHPMHGGRPLTDSQEVTIAISTVLTVDDDVLVQLNTVMMLEDIGHQVFKAYSGKEALAVLAREPSIEVVVTDLGMPHMNGKQMIAVARGLYPKLKFVLATGYDEDPDSDHPMLLRLPKPFGQDELAQAIQSVLGEAQANRRIIQFPASSVSKT